MVRDASCPHFQYDAHIYTPLSIASSRPFQLLARSACKAQRKKQELPLPCDLLDALVSSGLRSCTRDAWGREVSAPPKRTRAGAEKGYIFVAYTTAFCTLEKRTIKISLCVAQLRP